MLIMSARRIAWSTVQNLRALGGERVERTRMAQTGCAGFGRITEARLSRACLHCLPLRIQPAAMLLVMLADYLLSSEPCIHMKADLRIQTNS